MHLPRGTYRLFSKVARFCVAHQLIEPGRPVVAGVSGGVDSMMLLEFLHWYSEQIDFPLVICHINHMIRGEEADLDESFVQAYCQERLIPFESVTAPIEDIARETNRGVEETGRAVRRAALIEIGRRYYEGDPLSLFNGIPNDVYQVGKISGEDVHDKDNDACSFAKTSNDDLKDSNRVGALTDEITTFDVALGHHMDDRAESILMHIGRGSGIAGLVGIRPRDGCFVRPFLDVRLEELIASAKELGVVWREDATNVSSDYLRNRIRQILVPAWRDVLGYDPVPRLASLGDLAAGDEETLSIFAKRALVEARLPDQSLSIAAICALPRGLALRVLRLFFEEKAESGESQDITCEKDRHELLMTDILMTDRVTFSAYHAVSILDLICRVDAGETTEGALDLPGGWTVHAKNGRLFLLHKKENVT